MPALRGRQGRAAGARRETPLRQQRRQRLITVALLAGLAVTVLAWSWSKGHLGRLADGTAALIDRQVAAVGLAVNNVLVAGRNETTQAQVLAALAVRSGQSILDFDPQDARARLIALGWIEDARVERRLPDTIIVQIVERRPLALWQTDGRHHLIDRNGVVITSAGLGRFAALPVVVGPDAPANAAALIDVLSQQPDLFSHVDAAVRVGGRRWSLQLKNGIRVDLPEEQPASAWNRLATLVREKQIFERDVMAIDLRLPDRLVVRMTPAAAEKRRNPGKDT